MSLDANKTTTANPTKPDAHNPVLYVDDYGIHTGNHIYRATFPSTAEPPTGIFLDITGGLAFGFSAWLNSRLIGSYLGLSYAGQGQLTLAFDNATLHADSDNILVIVMDNSGHDLREAAVQPRGISNATLLGPTADRASGGPGYRFGGWKIAGGGGGAEAALDRVRGPLNEGGLFAERVGAHLPGFPETGTEWEWADVGGDGDATLRVEGAGIRVFRTVVPLRVPRGLDVAVTFRLTVPEGSSNRLRALLFVNGYQYGRFSPYIGNQVDFPVPPGVLDYDGDNTVAVTVWSQSAEGAEVGVEWNLDYVHSSSFDMGFDGAHLRPGWTEDRLKYA